MDGRHLAADRWREDYRIAGVEALELHHLYRAMAWLGGALPEPEQDARTPFASRCTKDLVEERLFAHRRDLCSRLDLVFMDTSSLYFEGTGGQTRGRHGHSKDHRPDLRQMILAVLIDDVGRPVCSECRATAQTAPWRHEELMGWTAPLPASTGHRRRWGRRVREPSTMKIATIGLDLARVCGQRAHLGRSGGTLPKMGQRQKATR